jgi:hypothetical protein
MDSNNDNRVNCYKCVHFTITWEPKYPRCCRLFGFKTAAMPSIAVFKSSGEPCAGFQKKASIKEVRRKGWEA